MEMEFFLSKCLEITDQYVCWCHLVNVSAHFHNKEFIVFEFRNKFRTQVFCCLYIWQMAHPIDLMWPLTWVNGFVVKFIGGGAQSTWRKRQICSTLLTNFYVVSSTPPLNEPGVPGENHRHIARHSWQPFTLYRVHHLSMTRRTWTRELYRCVAGHWQIFTLYRVHPMNPMHVENTTDMYYAGIRWIR